MKTSVTVTAAPAASQIAQYTPGATYFDTYEMAVGQGSLSALEIFLLAVSSTPAWVNQLMSLRNQVVKRLGLKDLGSLGAVDGSKKAADYRVGDRIGIFTIHSISDAELVVADSDHHLDARVSVCKTGNAARPAVSITTVVHVHNRLGRVYIAVVAPVHRIIVPAMLRKLAHRLKPRP